MKGLLIAAFVAGITVGVAAYSVAVASKAVPRKRTKQGDTPATATTGSHKTEADTSSAGAADIYAEQFVRNTKFFGNEGQTHVHDAFVVVVGVGGVGSHCATSLVRSGVGKIRLIDFDQVSVSSLNRHAVARQRDVGLSKVQVLKNEFAEICPRAEVDIRTAFFSLSEAPTLLEGNPDFVVDCIDNLETKAELITYCENNNIEIISSMGAGAKADVCQLAYGTLMDVEGCDLGFSLRARVRKMGHAECRIPVVFSTEKAWMKLLPLDKHQEDDPSQYKPIDTLRVRVIPVLGTMPAAMGLALASYVICDLAQKPIGQKPLFWPVGPNFMRKMHARVRAKAQKAGLWCDVDYEEMAYVVTHIFRGRSVLSGSKIHPILVRWDNSKPFVLENLVQLTEEEALLHRKVEKIEDLHPEYRKKVQKLLAEVQEYSNSLKDTKEQYYQNYNGITNLSRESLAGTEVFNNTVA